MPRGNATTQAYQMALGADNKLWSVFVGLKATNVTMHPKQAAASIRQGNAVFVKAGDKSTVERLLEGE